MIVSLSFKRVRCLLHRYVVPGLCASAIALGGCAVPPTTAPPTEQKEPVAILTKAPITTVTAEPAMRVGDVDAVYVTLTTFRPIIVSRAYADSHSGGRIEPLKLGLAIEKAGGADKLLAALGGRGVQSEKVDPEKDDLGPVRSANSHCVVRTGFLVAVVAIGLPVELASIGSAPGGEILGSLFDAILGDCELPTAEQAAANRAAAKNAAADKAAEEVAYHKRLFATFSDEQKIEDEELLQVPYVLLTAEERKGYLFFPRGSYTALELPVEEADRVPVNGKLSTLMLRCPWQQGQVMRKVRHDWNPRRATNSDNQRMSRFALFKPPSFCRCLSTSATSARASEEDRP
jgi:hypothetical protein